VPEIVALGDSLTSGRGLPHDRAYPAVLQTRLDEAGLRYKMINAGVSGDTSRRAAARFDDLFTSNVRVAIIALGANDGLRGVPIAQLQSNLSRIIEAAQARHIDVLLCGMEALPIYGWDYSVNFHKAFTELSRTYNVPLVPFILANVIANPDLMQPDHAHPNAEGARVIADNIWPHLKRLLTPIQASLPIR
jgi:acyl-CoA thioesterase-1